MKQKFNVTGMTCASCQSRVEKSVRAINGVNEASVNLLKNTMNVDFDENMTSNQAVIEAVKKSGYNAFLSEKKNTSNVEPINQEYKDLKKRVIISFVFAIPLFYLAMGHMMSWYLPSIFLGIENSMIFGITEFLLLALIVFINFKYFKNGFKALINLSPNMDSLVAIGSSAAIIYGIYALYKIAYGLGHNDSILVNAFLHDLYFESAGTILTLINLGKYFEAKAKGKTSEAITKLLNLAPKKANVLRNDEEIIVYVNDLVVGDIVISKAGEVIPCDGIIIEGYTSVDESMITGESFPVDKNTDDKVIGGTINKSGYIKIKATNLKDDSTLQKIIKLVDEATSSKANIAKLADKISLYFVPIVITISIISTIIWLILGYGLEFSISIGIAVLVVSCPCALGLATPTAIMVGTGKGASSGVLFKSAQSLETLHNVRTVVLDKTGTITKGEPIVTDILTFGLKENELLAFAISVEATSSHPLSKAVVKKGFEAKAKYFEVKDLKNIPSKGITAFIDGKMIIAGNNKLMNEYSIDLSFTDLDKYKYDGKTALFYAYDNKLIGIILLMDEIKESSKEAISLLKKLKINVIMLTGDNLTTANAINKIVCANEVISEVLPEDKDNVITKLKENGNVVAMVGDGINDSIALARADVGIAIGAGSDVSIESADVVLMKNELIDVYNAILISKATIINIKENLFWAFIYNIIGIPIACGIFYFPLGLKLNPMLGALFMGFSSVFVVLNALRLKLFKIKGIKKLENKMEDKIMNKEIIIEGMMCQNCVKHVKKALEQIEGLEVCDINFSTKKALVKVANDTNDLALKEAIEEEGYKVVGINTYESK